MAFNKGLVGGKTFCSTNRLDSATLSSALAVSSEGLENSSALCIINSFLFFKLCDVTFSEGPSLTYHSQWTHTLQFSPPANWQSPTQTVFSILSSLECRDLGCLGTLVVQNAHFFFFPQCQHSRITIKYWKIRGNFQLGLRSQKQLLLLPGGTFSKEPYLGWPFCGA